MASRKEEIRIEKRIEKVANGELTPKESGVNTLINHLKQGDEAKAESLMKDYIEAVKTANKNKD